MTTSTTPAQTIQRPQLLRGKARALELAAEAERERTALAAELVADLGRPVTTADRVLVEEIAALRVRARRLRQRGRDDAAEMCSRLILRGLAKLNVRPGEAKPESLEDYLRRTERKAASAGQASDESRLGEQNYQDDDERTGGHANGEASA